MVIQYLTKSSSKSDDKFCNSEWGPEATEAMCNEVRQFKVPGKDGKVLTLGDYIDRTPKELIVKVMLEEKVFDTWYCNRTVLLGDGNDSPFLSFVLFNLHQCIFNRIFTLW